MTHPRHEGSYGDLRVFEPICLDRVTVGVWLVANVPVASLHR